MEEKSKAEVFGNWLRERIDIWRYKNRTADGLPSQADFASRVIVDGEPLPTSSLSNILNGRKTITNMKLVTALAEILGPEVYDQLDMPRMMPKNKKLRRLIDWWSNPDTTDAEREWLYEVLQNREDEKSESQNPNAHRNA